MINVIKNDLIDESKCESYVQTSPIIKMINRIYFLAILFQNVTLKKRYKKKLYSTILQLVYLK